MVAYIFLLVLVRGLDKPPTMNGLFQLDVGFTCFCLFCLGSTFASLGIRLPELPNQEEADERPSLPKLLAARLGTRGVLTLAACLTAASAVLLVVGVVVPCMALRLDLTILYDN